MIIIHDTLATQNVLLVHFMTQEIVPRDIFARLSWALCDCSAQQEQDGFAFTNLQFGTNSLPNCIITHTPPCTINTKHFLPTQHHSHKFNHRPS